MRSFRRHIIAWVLFLVFQLTYSNAAWAQSEGVSKGKKAVEEWAAEGDQNYRMGNYDVAIAYYGLVLGANYASAELYYNLGNAYYRTDQIGPAVLYYERALRLKPQMHEARENLALAERKTVDRIAVLPQFFLVRWVDALCNALSPAAWRMVWLLLLALLVVAVVAFSRCRRSSARKGMLAVVAVILLLFLPSTWLLLRSTARYNAHARAVVMTPAVTVKSSPEEGSVDKMILHEGTVVTIGDSLSGWYKITIADGTTGWCVSTEIERI